MATGLSSVVPGLTRDPYAAADVALAQMFDDLLQQLLPVVMGPGSSPGRRMKVVRCRFQTAS